MRSFKFDSGIYSNSEPLKTEIVNLISRFIQLTSQEEHALNQYLPIKTFPKKHILLQAGQVSNASYFNIEGLVRKYYLTEDQERTTEFYEEEMPISSLHSFVNKVPCDHYLECIEESRLAILTRTNEKILFDLIPAFESLCRSELEQELGHQQSKLSSFIISSPEQRYADLLQNRPSLLQRVPQYHLASYLGIQPESLSRLRKRILSK